MDGRPGTRVKPLWGYQGVHSSHIARLGQPGLQTCRHSLAQLQAGGQVWRHSNAYIAIVKVCWCLNRPPQLAAGLDPLQDCGDYYVHYGFGTYAASLIGGLTVGVAKNVTIYSGAVGMQGRSGS
jgi:hypothetical protein